jgi:hypothetical protein
MNTHNQMFWNMAACHWTRSSQRFEGSGAFIYRVLKALEVGNCLPKEAAGHSGIFETQQHVCDKAKFRNNNNSFYCQLLLEMSFL